MRIDLKRLEDKRPLILFLTSVFDPGEENKFAYTDIHKEYKTMVRHCVLYC